jgi:L-threonylcarbamoyladenylate synthase
MPSANKFGHVSPTTSLHVMGEFPSDDVLIVEDEGGREEDRVGIESTVVKLTEGGGGEVGVQVLRPGAVTGSMIEGCLKEGGIEYEVKEPPRKALGEDEESNGAPGQNVKHYAPTVPAFIWKGGEGGMEQLESTVVIDFGAELAGLQGRALGYRTLSPGGDAREAGRLIYETLRWAEGVEGAKWIALPDLRGVEDERVEGVRDRIWRAASGVVKGGEKV